MRECDDDVEGVWRSVIRLTLRFPGDDDDLSSEVLREESLGSEVSPEMETELGIYRTGILLLC